MSFGGKSPSVFSKHPRFRHPSFGGKSPSSSGRSNSSRRSLLNSFSTGALHLSSETRSRVTSILQYGDAMKEASIISFNMAMDVGDDQEPFTPKARDFLREMTISVKALHAPASVREPSSVASSEQPPLRILSLDGGGIKGYNLLEMLLRLEKRCGLPVTDLFDLVVGTSIGGTIALALTTVGGKAGCTTVELLLDSLASDVMAKGSLLHLLRSGQKIPQSAVSKFARKALGIIGAEENDKIPPPRGGQQGRSERRPHCCVTTSHWDQGEWGCMMLGNYDRGQSSQHRMDGSREWSLSDAMMATTAAPTYFGPVHVAGRSYMDGGLTANNPTLHAVLEAGYIWPGRRIGCIISLGCGKYSSVEKASSMGTLYWIGQLMAIATSVEKVHKSVDALAHTLNIDYWRFEPDKAGNTPLDESRRGKLDMMRQLTRRYLSREEQTFDQMCLSLLKATCQPSSYAGIRPLLRADTPHVDVCRAISALQSVALQSETHLNGATDLQGRRTDPVQRQARGEGVLGARKVSCRKTSLGTYYILTTTYCILTTTYTYLLLLTTYVLLLTTYYYYLLPTT